MLRIFLIFTLLLSNVANASPEDSSLEVYTDVQIYFGNIADLKCCHLLKKGDRSPFDGFILEPYQLVFLKDTIDSWQEDLNYQLLQSETLCQEKISLCQDNRSLILDQYKQETEYYLDLNQTLNDELIKVKSNFNTFKIITYISVPILVSLGAYITYKL